MRSLLVGFTSLVSLGLTLSCGSVCWGQTNDQVRRPPDLGTGGGIANAQQLFDQSKYQRALEKCDQKLNEDFPGPVYNRIQALATRCCLLLNRRDDALRRIEAIHDRDPASPYLSLIPLVWDDRLPASERYTAPPKDLHSKSLTRRLAAASALLHESQFTAECVKVLTEVRASRRRPVSILAEIQLWRLQMSDTESVHLPTIRRWQNRTTSLPETLRAGAKFVVGRALQLRHKPDQASLELLWLPLMETDDPYLAASGLAESVVCLETTGRLESARRLRRELQDRFRDSSAARRLADPDSKPAGDD